MWYGIAEGALGSTTLRPVQFHDIWSRSGAVPPERALAVAVVQEALDDLARYRFARLRRGQRLYWQAYAWVAADDRVWPFSFVNLCEATGLTAEAVRRQALDPMTPRASDHAVDGGREAMLGKAA